MSRKLPPLAIKDLRAHYTRQASGYPRTRLKLGPDVWREKRAKQLPAGPRPNDELDKLNVLWLTESGLPHTQAEILADALANATRRGNNAAIHSALLQNLFLAEEREGTFGDFLDAEWEEAHRKIEAYEIPYHKDSFAVIHQHLYENYILSYRLGGLKAARERIEALTQDEMRFIVNQKSVYARPTTVSSVIDALLAERRGELPQNPPLEQLRNVFFKAFAKAIAKSSESAGYRFDSLSVTATNSVIGLSKSVYENPSHEKVGQVSTAEAMVYARFVEQNAELLGPHKVVTLIVFLNDPMVFGRGERKRLREFLIKATKHEDAVELFSSLVDLAINYRGALPTSKEWLASLESELVLVGDGVLLAELVTQDTAPTSTRKSQTQLQQQLGI